jgi:hypothetical protein
MHFLHTHELAIEIWFGAVCTFAIFSLLYKENPYYRFFEHVFIGLAAGQGIYVAWAETLKPEWWDKMVGAGQWWWALAVVPGAMFYFIYGQKHLWISRVIFGFLMGLGAGMIFQSFANVYIPMIKASFKPIVPAPGIGISLAISNLVFVVVLITVMSYFFFSIDHKARAVRGTASLGRWFLMFAFGAIFGSTVMARMSLFIGRLDFLLTDWKPLVPAWFWIMVGGAAVLLAAAMVIRPRRRRKPPVEE